MEYFLAFAFAAGVSLVSTPVVRQWAERRRLLDYPNGKRKIHSRPIPLAGGLAIFFSVTIGIIVFANFGSLLDGRISWPALLAILIGGALLIIGGLIDDRYTLQPVQQLIAPALAVSVAVGLGVHITFVTNPTGGVIEFAGAVGAGLAAGWLLLMIFTAKLLDGLDGLVTGVTAIGSFVIFGVSIFWDAPRTGTSILALLLAGACVGFLVYNWHPAKIFLGEGGAIFCGFMLGILSIISGSKVATALLVMGVPLLDLVWVVLQRLFSRQSIARGDRRHLHYRLLDIGLTHRQAVLVIYLTTAGFGLIAVFFQTTGKLIALGILAVGMAVLVGFLRIRFQHQQTHG